MLQFVLLVLPLCSCLAHAQRVECRDGIDAIDPLDQSAFRNITDNPDLSSLSGHGPTEVILSQSGWCFEVPELRAVSPYLQFDFTETHVLYSFVIAGVSSSNSNSYGYVVEFQVEVDASGTGDYQPIICGFSNSLVCETNLMSTNETQPVLLTTTGVAARSLRIRPYSWSANPSCMRIAIEGCLAADQVTMPPTGLNSISTIRVLTIALPIAIVTIVIVAAIALISVVCCYISHRSQKVSSQSIDINDDTTIKHIRNELYSSSKHRGLSESSNSTALMLSNDPQPYEVARPSNADLIEPPITVELIQQSSSMSSAGSVKVKTKHRAIKAYKTVTLEKVHSERNKACSADTIANDVKKEHHGYETVTVELESNGVVLTQAEVANTELSHYETPSVDDTHTGGDNRDRATGEREYLNLQTPSQNNPEDKYFNVSADKHVKLEKEHGLSESQGPEHFHV